MTELEILAHLKANNGSVDYVDLLNLGRTGQAHDTLMNDNLIKDLINKKILAGEQEAYGRIRFGAKGRLRLQELQQLQQESAEEAAQATKEKRAQRRHDWLVATIGAAIGSILGSLLTLLAQHFLLL